MDNQKKHFVPFLAFLISFGTVDLIVPAAASTTERPTTTSWWSRLFQSKEEKEAEEKQAREQEAVINEIWFLLSSEKTITLEEIKRGQQLIKRLSRTQLQELLTDITTNAIETKEKIDKQLTLTDQARQIFLHDAQFYQSFLPEDEIITPIEAAIVETTARTRRPTFQFEIIDLHSVKGQLAALDARQLKNENLNDKNRVTFMKDLTKIAQELKKNLSLKLVVPDIVRILQNYLQRSNIEPEAGPEGSGDDDNSSQGSVSEQEETDSESDDDGSQDGGPSSSTGSIKGTGGSGTGTSPATRKTPEDPAIRKLRLDCRTAMKKFNGEVYKKIRDAHAIYMGKGMKVEPNEIVRCFFDEDKTNAALKARLDQQPSPVRNQIIAKVTTSKTQKTWNDWNNFYNNPAWRP